MFPTIDYTSCPGSGGHFLVASPNPARPSQPKFDQPQAPAGVRGEAWSLRRRPIRFGPTSAPKNATASAMLRRGSTRIEHSLSEVRGHLRFSEPKPPAARRAISIPDWLPDVLTAGPSAPSPSESVPIESSTRPEPWRSDATPLV